MHKIPAGLIIPGENYASELTNMRRISKLLRSFFFFFFWAAMCIPIGNVSRLEMHIDKIFSYINSRSLVQSTLLSL